MHLANDSSWKCDKHNHVIWVRTTVHEPIGNIMEAELLTRGINLSLSCVRIFILANKSSSKQPWAIILLVYVGSIVI